MKITGVNKECCCKVLIFGTTSICETCEAMPMLIAFQSLQLYRNKSIYFFYRCSILLLTVINLCYNRVRVRFWVHSCTVARVHMHRSYYSIFAELTNKIIIFFFYRKRSLFGQPRVCFVLGLTVVSYGRFQVDFTWISLCSRFLR
jgi:hypothetical protein